MPAYSPPPVTPAGVLSTTAGGATLRDAARADVDALEALERASFAGDRLSRRSWLRLIERSSAEAFVVADAGRLLGAAVLLFNERSSVARLYSIAVAGDARGQGTGRLLARSAVARAQARNAARLRLETRVDNRPAQDLFRSLGFRPAGRRAGYYHDGTDALLMERPLWDGSRLDPPAPFPYYAQTLDFTCGPCALMMAMGRLDPGLVLDRRLEMRLWREATTVFMAAGHGGCGPLGLALSAHRRGFGVTVYEPSASPMFVDSVRDRDKKDVIALIERDLREELAHTPVVLHRRPATISVLLTHLARGEVPVVLISLWRLHGEKGPHWVTVTGFDGHRLRLHDPMSPPVDGGDCGVSVTVSEFQRISRYGRSRQSAAVMISLKGQN